MYSGRDYLGAIVADIGSFSSKIGFAGDDYPRASFQTVFYYSNFILLIAYFV